MFTFLHAADIHLDSPLRGLEAYRDAPLEQIRGASRRAFDNLVELAIDEQVAFVLLAGDLYDGDWKDYNTGIYFVNRMGRLRDAGIPVFMVSGNHDAASQITRTLRLPDNVTLFSHRTPETLVLEHLGVAIHGQSFSARAVADDLARQYPQGDPGLFNIGLLHTSLNGRPGHEPYAPCTLDGLRSKGYQYWGLGHVHQREEICRDPWILFPGAIQGRHIRETGPKGCALVTVDDGQVVAVEQRDLDVLRWALLRIEPGGCDGADPLLELVREHIEDERRGADGRPLAVRLMLEGTTPLHDLFHENPAHWHEELRALTATFGDVWLEKVVVATRPPRLAPVRPDDDSALASLSSSLEELYFQPNQVPDLVPEFGPLRAKLPPELLSGDDPFDPGEVELKTMRQDVKALLLARIRQGGRRAN